MNSIENLKIWKFEIRFLGKKHLFLKMEMDNPFSNLTCNTMHCVAIDWYQETSIWMVNGFVNVEIDLKKATHWSSTKSSYILKWTMRSRYQSIDTKHTQVHVQFEGRLSTQLWRKKRYKKSWTFSKGVPCPFFKSWSMNIYRLEFSAVGWSLAQRP
jgi:hypothetical protein